MREFKQCFGKCDRCVWKYNGGCSEWNGWRERKMPERRLIDANALNFLCGAVVNEYGCGFLDGVSFAERKIIDAPTIDTQQTLEDKNWLPF